MREKKLTTLFAVRLDKGTTRRLKEISTRTGGNQSDAIRHLIQTAPSHTELISKQKGK